MSLEFKLVPYSQFTGYITKVFTDLSGSVLFYVDFFCVAVGKLMELHGEGGSSSTAKPAEGETGAKVERADGYEPPVQESV